MYVEMHIHYHYFFTLLKKITGIAVIQKMNGLDYKIIIHKAIYQLNISISAMKNPQKRHQRITEVKYLVAKGKVISLSRVCYNVFFLPCKTAEEERHQRAFFAAFMLIGSRFLFLPARLAFEEMVLLMTELLLKGVSCGI